MIIRDATDDDEEILAAIFRRASLSNDGDRDALLANPDALEVTTVLDGRRRVAELDGVVAGFATTVPVEGGGVELIDLFVDPALMHQGVATALIDDIPAGRIEVIANPHAAEFYASAGFVALDSVETRLGEGTRMVLERPGS